MVCRTTRIGSAVTSHARLSSGLLDQQTLSTYHHLLREGRDQPDPSREEIAAAVDRHMAAVRSDPQLTPARRDSILTRLAAARDERMDGRTYYAITRLTDRAAHARAAYTAYCDEVGRDLGWSRSQVEEWLSTRIRTADTSGRSVAAPTAWRRGFEALPERAAMPFDRATAYAVHEMEQVRAQFLSTRPHRPTVNPTGPAIHTQRIASAAYDPESRRLEVTLSTNPGVTHAYRVPPHMYEEMTRSASPEQYYAERIRHNPDCHYPTSADATADGIRTQCATCGQFAGPGHRCPVRDSAEEQARTVRLARQAARRNTTPAAGGEADGGEADGGEADGGEAAGETVPPTVTGRTWRYYHDQTSTLRCPNLTAVRQDARHQQRVRVPVHATVFLPDTDVHSERVQGHVDVTYLGRGDGFQVAAVTEPGDTGVAHLRCTCAEYRARYDCPHVRQTVADMQRRLNADRITDRRIAASAQQSVATDLARDRADSLAAQQDSTDRWGPAEVSYVEDMDAFQSAYEEAKRRQEAGEPPVGYMTENATAGLGARDGGRSFGMELEFDFPPGVDRQAALAAIGRDLHAAGLTPVPYQEPYHAARRRGYTENQQGGWTFEQDATVAGEVVSPICYDEPEMWRNLEQVCAIVRRHGGTASVRAGSHIHVSTHNYDHIVENHNRLMRTFSEYEDVIYRVSTNPERGTHRGLAWCAPNRVPAEGYRDVDSARSANYGHHQGVNMESMSGRISDHVEFRTWDSSLDPAVIQTQIKISLGLTEAAFRDRDVTPEQAEPLGSHRTRNRREFGTSRRLTGDAWRQDTASFRRFADRLFRRARDKAQLASLFATTSWQVPRG